jgi:hypothetical protein
MRRVEPSDDEESGAAREAVEVTDKLVAETSEGLAVPAALDFDGHLDQVMWCGPGSCLHQQVDPFTDAGGSPALGLDFAVDGGMLKVSAEVSGEVIADLVLALGSTAAARAAAARRPVVPQQGDFGWCAVTEILLDGMHRVQDGVEQIAAGSKQQSLWGGQQGNDLAGG